MGTEIQRGDNLDGLEKLRPPNRDWLIRAIQVYLDCGQMPESMFDHDKVAGLADHILGNWEMIQLWP